MWRNDRHDLKRPLNKGQGHSFISYRLSVVTFALVRRYHQWFTESQAGRKSWLALAAKSHRGSRGNIHAIILNVVDWWSYRENYYIYEKNEVNSQRRNWCNNFFRTNQARCRCRREFLGSALLRVTIAQQEIANSSGISAKYYCPTPVVSWRKVNIERGLF